MATEPNSLGLENLHIDPAKSSQIAEQAAEYERSPDESLPEAKVDVAKTKPYVNPERVKTGGAQREKLSEEELAERMARIKEANRRINERRKDVKADEEAFKLTQESERIKHAQTRQVQQNVDRTREQNARRKMDKIQSREWDSGKKPGEWKQTPRAASETAREGGEDAAAGSLTEARRGVPPSVRGRGRGRGRGEGRGPTERRGEKLPEQTEESVPVGTAL